MTNTIPIELPYDCKLCPYSYQITMSSETSSPTIYFGYGSNLWLHQMDIRCPTSTYLGVARLNNYRWMINDRGYANVVEVSSASSSNYKNVVFGLVYSLEAEDEKRLDRNEGVPIAYTKEDLECDFWEAKDGAKVDVSKSPTESKKMLVYIDRKRTTDDKPKEEYIYRMNKGIDDAIRKGVPTKYVDDVMRKFIPADDDSEGSEITATKAHQQAVEFIDEN